MTYKYKMLHEVSTYKGMVLTSINETFKKEMLTNKENKSILEVFNDEKKTRFIRLCHYWWW